MAMHTSILAWRIPWTEEPGGLQPTELPRVRHDWVTKQKQPSHSSSPPQGIWNYLKLSCLIIPFQSLLITPYIYSSFEFTKFFDIFPLNLSLRRLYEVSKAVTFSSLFCREGNWLWVKQHFAESHCGKNSCKLRFAQAQPSLHCVFGLTSKE